MYKLGAGIIGFSIGAIFILIVVADTRNRDLDNCKAETETYRSIIVDSLELVEDK